MVKRGGRVSLDSESQLNRFCEQGREHDFLTLEFKVTEKHRTY